jgi:hypothetical protein
MNVPFSLNADGSESNQAEPKSPGFDYDAWQQEEINHQSKMSEAARNSPFFVQCDEEIFELNDDGSTRVHKSTTEKPEPVYDELSSFVNEEAAQKFQQEEEGL